LTVSAIFCAAAKSNVLMAMKAPTPWVGANEDTLQAPGFLQNQRVRGRRRHDHPPETHRIHAAGFVEAEYRIKVIAPHISGVVSGAFTGMPMLCRT
jgi:hypothetical protein